jgi:hypothetical protein
LHATPLSAGAARPASAAARAAVHPRLLLAHVGELLLFSLLRQPVGRML